MKQLTINRARTIYDGIKHDCAAAAERMRDAAADVVNTMTGEARGLSAEMLDLKLEPEEPTR